MTNKTTHWSAEDISHMKELISIGYPPTITDLMQVDAILNDELEHWDYFVSLSSCTKAAGINSTQTGMQILHELPVELVDRLRKEVSMPLADRKRLGIKRASPCQAYRARPTLAILLYFKDRIHRIRRNRSGRQIAPRSGTYN